MTEQEKNDANSPDLLEGVEFLCPDYTLDFLQHMANEVGIGVPVALNVGGTTITGNLVSGRAFFEEQARRLREHSATVVNNDTIDPNGEAIQNSLRIFADGVERLGERYRDLTPSADGQRGEDDQAGGRQALTYVHLNSATSWGPTTHDLGWWRGRLASVDGWTIASPTPEG